MPPRTLAALAVVELELSACAGESTSELAKPETASEETAGFDGGSTTCAGCGATTAACG